MVRRHAYLALALAAAAGAFLGVVHLPFVFFDDIAYVVRNPLVAAPLGQGPEALLRTAEMGYPIPVTVLSWALDRRLWGMDPSAFHAVNLALHLAVVALLYVVGLRLGLAAAWAGRAAALFAVHPLVTEPVAWVTGRKDILAAALLLGSVATLLGGRRTGSAPTSEGSPAEPPGAPSAGRWTAVLILAFLAVLSKPSALAAPGVLYLAARLGRRGWPAREVARALVLPAVLIAGLAILGARGHVAVQHLSPRGPGAVVADVLGALALQVGHLVWPRGLLCTYYRSATEPSGAAMALALAAVVGAMVATRRLAAPGSPARWALALAGLTYLPVSGVVANLRWTADSYVYLPLAGLALAIMALGEQRWPRRLVGFPVVVGLLALLSFHQVEPWRGSLALLRPVVARYPDEPWAWNRLGFAQLAEGERAAAMATFIDLDARFPEFPSQLAARSWAHSLRGNRARAAALQDAGVRAGEREAAARAWNDVLTGKRSPGDVPADVVARLWRLGGYSLTQGRDLRRAAELLRSWGYPADAAQAEKRAR